RGRLFAPALRRARLLRGEGGTGVSWSSLARRAIIGPMTMAPIHDPLAAALARKAANGAAGEIADVPIASGEGWRVQDIICTCGPHDHEPEELTSASSVALVLSGSFVVRDRHGTSLLSEGSYLLVNAGCCFACSHRHGVGDRCLS